MFPATKYYTAGVELSRKETKWLMLNAFKQIFMGMP
jgi:hypothetical protein